MSGASDPSASKRIGPRVPERVGAAFAVREVRLEGRFFRSVVRPRRPQRRHRLARRSAHSAPSRNRDRFVATEA